MSGTHTNAGTPLEEKGAAAAAEAVDAPAPSDELRYRSLSPPFLAFFVIATLAGIALAINQLFNLQFFAGIVLVENAYLYLLAGIYIALAFLVFPASKRAATHRVPWYDLLLAAATLAVAGYFVSTSRTALSSGWEMMAPQTAVMLSFVFWALILEGARRTGGSVVFFVILLFSIYPWIADKVPGPISGMQRSLEDTAIWHIISAESAFGIPMKAFGELVVGFIVFGAALQQTGAGQFFNNLALGLVGGYRGGGAKVAIFASGLMGSISGSVVSNVVTTGAVTIPAMKRTGFTAKYAAGVEACASTGAVLMPPVMGTTAFVMAAFLGMPYAEIAMAAAIPSILYYLALFVQIDAYAARRGLKGLARSELPNVPDTIKQGWYYILVFGLLIYFMLFTRQETLAPFYATAALLVMNQVLPGNRLSLRGMVHLIAGIGRALSELVAVLVGVGLIIGAFSVTGLAGTLANDLVFLAGNQTLVLLIMGALTSFIFGMGMTVTACYIFLAIILAPALTSAGLDRLAVHLFILYWGMVSFITPPVAIGAFAAASIARANPMAVGYEAMRLGSLMYFVPFFFVLNPALIGQGSAAEISVVLTTAVLGVFFIGAAIQGYIAGLGEIGRDLIGNVLRLLLFAAGLFFAAPGSEEIGLGHFQLSLIGLALGAPAFARAYFVGKRASAQLPA